MISGYIYQNNNGNWIINNNHTLYNLPPYWIWVWTWKHDWLDLNAAYLHITTRYEGSDWSLLLHIMSKDLVGDCYTNLEHDILSSWQLKKLIHGVITSYQRGQVWSSPKHRLRLQSYRNREVYIQWNRNDYPEN